MVDLKDKKLNEKLKELEKQRLPSVEEIRQENKSLSEKEAKFKAKFRKK